MKKITLYHNSRCSKCREAFSILEQAKVPFDVVEYLVTPPTAAVLDGLLKQLSLEPAQIVRKGEDEYASLDLEKNPPKTREKWLKVLTENPILIERPIVSDGTTAVIGRPPEKVKEWLRNKVEKST